MSNELAERLRTVLTLDPGEPAIEFAGEWTDWAALHTIATEVEQRLTATGLDAGAPVSVVLRNHPAMVGALIGVLLAGATTVTVNAAQGDTGLSADIAELNLAAVIALESDWQRVGVRDAATGALGLRVANDPAGVTAVTGLEAPGPGPFRPEPDGIAVEMLTSGTTGPPKRIPLTYQAFGNTVAVAAAHYSGSGNNQPRLRSGVAIVSSPLVHMSGLFRTLMNLCEGRRIALLERFRVTDFVDLVLRHQPRAVSLVPSALSMVLDAHVEPEVFASVEVVTSGTAHLPVTVQEAFEKRYDVAVMPSYGATEFAGGVAGWNLALHREWATSKRGSVGRPQRGREVRIVSLDDDSELGPGAQGRIEVRTEGREWVRTTDIGRIDADGFLYVDGRTDDIIIRGGFKVAPADVVEALRSHPAVRDAGVTGLPDERLGAVPAAAVELCSSAAADANELLDFLRDRLTRYQLPARLIIVGELPRTPSMKVSQPALRELFDDVVEVRA
ncbi:class I adenylate-forming enzyme family protein [Mycobacterium stomatepiae]|uniref:O-succinylbenzoate--CoA ligase n=1 Tax=Mycobacterium stomatepiae TaxID=470076 RepID=A0A7I7Q6K2_9MYCO|nr:class I adenylate-forming enzyme family protein [Mycobacterium stomatepiae]MCV7168119.1 acyl--CoA ligase [Mycobacterium stomatepiae]BBY21985.1 o-succinylbenzoate--CoA ligase [Mycobacterium stomatepiae]